MADDDQLTQDLASLRIPREAPRGQPTRSALLRPGGGGPAPGRRWIGWGIALVLLVGTAAAAVLSGAAASVRDRLVVPEVRLSQVALVSPSQADVILVATGYVVSRHKATLAPKTLGRVSRILFREGDRVREGQVVAELERNDVEAQLAQARADVATAHARVEQVRADLADADNKAQRESRLLGGGAGTPAASQDAGARVNLLRAQLAAALADEKAQQTRVAAVLVQIDNTRVRAPFNGTVLRKLTEVGEVVSPTPAGGVGGIFLVAALDELEVEADVAESQLYKIIAAPDAGAEQQNAPAEIVLDAFPERRYRGQVSEIRPTVDRAKATVTVKVRFVDSAEGVLPDMGAKVSFLARPLDRAALAQAPRPVVPADAVVERNGVKVVLAVEGNVVRAVPVQVKGPAGAGQVEIVDGPAPGTPVVRAPAADLRTGTRVKPAEG